LFGGCDRVPLGLVRGFMAAILQWFELLYTQTAKKCANDGVCGQTCSARTFDTTPPRLPTIRVLFVATVGMSATYPK